MKVALVHDQLREFGGAERVLVELKAAFPSASVYTSFFDGRGLGEHATLFDGWDIRQSWAAKIPFVARLYSPLRFLTPLIWESLDLNEYDLVISSSGWYMSKGVITRPETVHICYLHHPPRYLYGYETAVEWKKYWPVKMYAHIVNHSLRMWDYLSSQRVDYFLANSQETKKRIETFYRRSADVIYPPVSVSKHERSKKGSDPRKREYYVTLSRLARAKHIDMLIEAANKEKFQLKIVGRGRDEEYLRGLAGPTVEFFGHVEDSDMDDLYAGAKAYLFASVDEEFGIAPVEAMSRGVPVIAYRSGGVKETVSHGKTGFLFDSLTADDVISAVRKIEHLSEQEHEIMRRQATTESQQYSAERFIEEIRSYVKEKRLRSTS